MKKINVAKLLKDCPKGIKLYSPIFGTVYFEGIRDTGIAILIDVTTSCNTSVQFYSNGKFNTCYSESEVTLFPSKSQRDWSKFQRPFKDGDILATDLGSVFFLNTRLNTDERYGCYVGIGGDGSFHICEPFAYKECCGFAKEEEKQKLFKAIKDNGYRWNAETKTLEELIEPKFKVGDRIKVIYNNNQYDIKELTDTHYTLVEVKYKFKYTEPISEDKKWELVPNKFDITTLKPFESRVLVRDNNTQTWKPAYWGFYDKTNNVNYPYIIVGGGLYGMSIPYENNEHLLNTTDDCDEFYKTWE